MKWRKMNRGCILLLTLILGVVVYLIIFHVKQNETKLQLIDLYEKYLEAEKPFLTLDNSDDTAWEENCTAALAPHLAQNTDAVKNTRESLVKNRKALKEQLQREKLGCTSFEKKILDRPPTLIVDGDYARLAIAIEITYVLDEYTSKDVRQKHILFCKEDGTWRITVPDGITPASLFHYVDDYDGNYGSLIDMYGKGDVY